MSLRLSPYPEYRDTGIPWLGPAPAHWSVRSLGSLTTPISQRGHPELPLLSVVREKGVIPRSSNGDDENHNYIPDNLSNYKVVREGNLVINKMKAWQGSLGLAPIDGIVSPAYFVFDIDIDERRYGHALLRSKPYVAFFAQASDGVRVGQWDLSIDGIKRIPVLIPPPEEQACIVSFLAAVDQRLNRLISARRRLIALLDEQKQAIIHRAVTRGLDPNVRLKPSGVNWLGDIPGDWEVGALRRFWEVVDCKHLTVPFVEEGIPLASVREVQSFNLDLTQAKKTTEEWYRHLIAGGREPQPGDLIYCRNTSVGACAYVNTDVDFAMGQDVCLIRSRAQNQRYLNYLLHSPFMDQQLTRLLVGSTFKRINISEIRALLVVLPPRNEQDAITDELDRRVGQYGAAITLTQREIELLREYRTRLIADVVTGKLDVRGVDLPPLDDAVDLDALASAEDAAEELDEQKAIAALIEHECTVLETTRNKAMCEIELLREYRTRLIADVVTGKLDVRGVELPPLDGATDLEPPEAAEIEGEDDTDLEEAREDE